MRRIYSKNEKLKKQKRNNRLLVIFLLLLLLGSTFGILVNSFGSSTTEGKLNYNGHNFIYYNGYWTIENSESLIFTYNPQETENLTIERNDVTNLLNSYTNVPVYIYSEDLSSKVEIYRNIYQVAERVQDACPEGRKCLEDLPVKDCSNMIIIIEVADKNEIYQEENCVYILGEKESLIKLSDEFLFRILGIK